MATDRCVADTLARKRYTRGDVRARNGKTREILVSFLSDMVSIRSVGTCRSVGQSFSRPRPKRWLLGWTAREVGGNRRHGDDATAGATAAAVRSRFVNGGGGKIRQQSTSA